MSATSLSAQRRGLIAILRGVRTEEAAEIAAHIFEAGIEAIEVPLNSPEPLRSIEAIACALPGHALIGAGTVLTPGEVDAVRNAGGGLIVSPNTDAAVIARTVEHGMISLPGVFSPTEAFAALAAGASALKLFPASVLGPGGAAAIGAVLPSGTKLAAVGGVSERDFAAYGKAGLRLFGLGSSFYRPRVNAAEAGKRARAAVAAWDEVFKDDAP